MGSKIYNYENPEMIQSVGIKINKSIGEFSYIGNKKKDIGPYSILENLDAVSGCSMLIKTVIFRKMGLLDPQYFLYLEDTDFCIRARKQNFTISCSTSSKVWHKSSVSSKKISGTMEFYSTRNLFLFIKKHSTKWKYPIFLVYFFLFRMWLTMAIILIYHKEKSAFLPFIKGIYEGIKIKPTYKFS